MKQSGRTQRNPQKACMKDLKGFSRHCPIKQNKMRIKQQAQKKISSGHGEEGALWMNKLHNEEPREVLAVWVEGGDKVAKQVVQSTPTNYLHCTYGWFREFARLILPYKLNLEPNPKMLNYSVYVFKAINLDKSNNLASETFYNVNTCCSEKPFELVSIKGTWETFALPRLGNVERFSHAFSRWQIIWIAV